MDKKLADFFDKKKKKSGELSDNEKSAKIHVLKDLQQQASKALSSKLHGLHSPVETPEQEAEETPEHEASETPEQELAEHFEPELPDHMDVHKPIEHMSEDEIDHHLHKLMEHKKKLKGEY